MELHEYFFLHHTLIACAMFSYNLDDPETKRIKVQSHSKKTVSFFIISSTCGWPRNQSSVSSWFFFSWQPTLDDKAACVSFSLCWLCCDFLFLTATQKTLAWDSASYSNQWTSEASFPGTFYYWNVKKQDTCTCNVLMHIPCLKIHHSDWLFLVALYQSIMKTCCSLPGQHGLSWDQQTAIQWTLSPGDATQHASS